MIRVLLAEDQHLVRGALVLLLGLEADMEVVAEVSSGDEIVPAVLRHEVDVAVLDIQLPGVDGLTAAARVKEHAPDCRVLILTGMGRPGMLRRALRDAEVEGFMVKDAPTGELAASIRQVAAGERVVDPALAAAALTSRPNPLTEQELKVLRLAAEGTEPADIAGRLHLSRGTVRNYLGAIVTKLGARNRLDAVRIAKEADWL